MSETAEDVSPSLLAYLLSITPEQAAEAVRSLPKEERIKLVSGVCGAVQALTENVVQTAEALWDARKA